MNTQPDLFSSISLTPQPEPRLPAASNRGLTQTNCTDAAGSTGSGESTSPVSHPKRADDDLRSVPVFRVELVQDRTFDGPVVTSPQDVARLACRFLERADREHFLVILLATSGRVIGINTAHVGSLSASIVCAREVFKPAILANAAAIVVAHNHPSGSLEPSREDVQTSKQLVAAGQLLSIHVHDSLIVTRGGRYTSLAERGLLQ